jgi:ketosteroid isomerase-like protein
MSPHAETPSPYELTRRSFEAADSGDFDRMISFYAPDSVFDMSPWGLGTYRGLPAIRAFESRR